MIPNDTAIHVQAAFDAANGRDNERIASLLVIVRRIARQKHVNMQGAQYMADLMERNGTA
jgi:hypothetical protein